MKELVDGGKPMKKNIIALLANLSISPDDIAQLKEDRWRAKAWDALYQRFTKSYESDLEGNPFRGIMDELLVQAKESCNGTK